MARKNSLFRIQFILDDLFRISKTPENKVLEVDCDAQVKCVIVTENKPCCHASLVKFLAKLIELAHPR
jgi:hypothetical protein